MTKKTLSSGGIVIRIDETAEDGVVIAGLQVIEAGFPIIVVTPITQGVPVGDVARVSRHVLALAVRDGDGPAPRVVHVPRHQVPRAVQKTNHVPLQVAQVLIAPGGPCAIGIPEMVRRPTLVVAEVQRLHRRLAGHRLLQQLPTGVGVVVNHRAPLRNRTGTHPKDGKGGFWPPAGEHSSPLQVLLAN